MKKIFLAAAPAMALALTACQSELTEPQAPATGTAVMKVEIEYPTDGTRTTLEEVEGERLSKLQSKWEEADQVVVYDAEGHKLGTLEIETIDDSGKKATFNGTLEGVEPGTQNYQFFYMPGNEQTAAPFTFDMAKQSGNAEDLKNYDFLRATTEVNVAGGIAYAEKMGLARSTAYGHFALNFPEGVTYNGEEITVVTGQGNACTLTSLNELTVTQGDIKVNTNDMYIAMLPMEAADIVMQVTIDGIDYKGNIGRTHEWKASEFVNAGFETGVPVNIKMEQTTKYTVNYVAINDKGEVVKDNLKTDEFTGASKVEYTVLRDFDLSSIWYGDNYVKEVLDAQTDGQKVADTVTLTKNQTEVTYYVVVAKNVYDLVTVIDNNGGKGGDTSAETYTGALPQTMDAENWAAPTRENYEFLGWSFDKNASTGDKELEVVFAVADKALAVEKDGKKTITKTVYAIWKQKKIEGQLPEDIEGSDW